MIYIPEVTTHVIKHVFAVCLWIAGAATASAQSDMRGHWSGNVETPDGPLGVEIDLDRTPSGWIGSLSMPTRAMTGIPLDSVTFADGKASFAIQGGPGGQRFGGTLSTDGKTLEGAFAAGPESHALKLTRTGGARVDLPKPNPAVAPEFLGTWAGTIQFDQLGGPPLRVTVTISNGTAGAEAQVVSLDQGNAQLPVNAIIQKGAKLTLEVKVAGGTYEGEINQAVTEMHGTWSQLGNSTALILKKATPAR
jgi:hypothetical protein